MSPVGTRLAALPAEKRRLLLSKLASKKQSAIPVQPRRVDRAPLSHAQQRFWFLQQLDPSSAQYNLPAAARINGPLDAQVLDRSFAELVRRHEALRTTFSNVSGSPVQVIAPDTKFCLQVSHAADLNQVTERMHAHASQPFDLEKGPLFRAELVELNARSHYLLLNAHHIVSDNWSAGILVRELLAVYEAYMRGRAPVLPQLPIRYSDFAAWQHLPEQEEELEKQLSYWRERLSGELPVLELPADHPRPATPGCNGAVRKRRLPDSLALRVKALSQQEGATPFMILLTAFNAVLARYTHQDDIIVGSPVSGRERVETHELIGCFVNTLALRTDCSGDPAFVELLRRVRKTCLDAFANQDVPFERVVQAVQPRRDASRTPVFQVAFGLRRDPAPHGTFGGSPYEVIETHTGMSKFDLMLEVIDADGQLTVAVEYNSDLFDAPTIDRLMGHYETLLAGAAAAPETPVSLLPLITAPERAQIAGWNNTGKQYPLDRCLHEFVEAQVDRTPDATAVVFGEERITYKQLDARANQLAWHLRSLGVVPNSMVGVAMERSIDLVISLHAVVKAGGAYVPIDPEYPADRVSHMLADSRPAVLLTQKHVVEKLPEYGGTVVVVDEIRKQLIQESPQRLSLNVGPSDMAYMIYTSGSTGRPKGAINTHRGIVNRLCWMQDEYRLDSSDRVLQKTPFSFDVSVWEFFWPFMTGASLVVAAPGGHRDSAYLARLIAEEGVTTLHFVPSMLQIFLDEPAVDQCYSLRRVICSGEALPLELQQRFFARMKAELHNLYGPTEAAVDVTYWKCDPHSPLRTVPIGRPIANTQIHLLDSRLNPVPVGIAAELYIAGVNVGLGYLNRPELTEEKFIADPFSLTPGARMYRTGDLARYLPDGTIDYLGRIDHQVKIRGFRIELGEIEAVLNQHPGVRESVVAALSHGSGEKRLAAWLVSSEAEPVPTETLRQHLAASLPDYMIPAAFTWMDAFPLSPNGKIDRRALPSPEFAPVTASTAPRDVLEQRLIAIWERILDVRPIGIRHNFFELGGHSLTALRLMAEVEREFAVRLPVAALFQTPTVESLAPALRNHSGLSWSQAVPIQKGKATVPLFFVPGGGGNMVYLTDLARMLGPAQTVYGMRYRGLDGEVPADTTVEAIAAHMVEAIESEQGSGPYRLGGHCFGGLVAFEIARQLVRKGKHVDLLAIVNTPAPVPRPVSAGGDPGQAQWIETIARAWEQVAGRCVPIARADIEGLGEDEQLELLRQAMVSADLLPAEADVKNIRGLVNVFRANSLARYQPEDVLPVPVRLFRASEFHPHFDFSAAEDQGVPVEQSTLGWKWFSTQPVTVHPVHGNHLTMLAETNLQALALLMQGCLAECSPCAGDPS